MKKLLSVLSIILVSPLAFGEEIKIPDDLERPFQIIQKRIAIGSAVPIQKMLASGTVEILDSQRESKIIARGTRTDWSGDSEGCSDVVFDYPERKSLEEIIDQEKVLNSEVKKSVQEGQFVAWVGRDEKTYILISRLGQYEFSTVWEISDWEAEDAWKARPYFGRACVIKGNADDLEEMLKILENTGIIGDYSYYSF